MLRNISWLTAVSIAERVFALAQTVILARVLGITDYGVYGLLFGTIGFAASTSAMQMGLTATVYVARFKDADKGKAAQVIQFVTRFANLVALLFCGAALPFTPLISHRLFGEMAPHLAVVAACGLVGLSVISGVQEGIIQGFEEFRTVAVVRLFITLLTVVLIYPAGRMGGLTGVMLAILASLSIKGAVLHVARRRSVVAFGLPKQGIGVSTRHLLLGFSLPSVLASMLTGAIGWVGSFMLSRQPGGFDALAIASTGSQWCGPVLLISATVSAVAVPSISRHYQRRDFASIRTILIRTLLWNSGLALLVATVAVTLSRWILASYGAAFVGGTFVFSFLVLSSIPQVIAGVFMQHLVAKGRMWRQLLMYNFLVVPMACGYGILIPKYLGTGFAITNLLAWSTFAVALATLRENWQADELAEVSGTEGHVSSAAVLLDRPKGIA